MEIQNIIQTVQRNCDISDARHAGDYTMCIYLLRMREYFRWRHGLDFGQPLDRHELAAWLTATEDDWERLQGESYQGLVIAGKLIDRFAVQAVNQYLIPQGFFYHAGIGRFGKPVFVLGKLVEIEHNDLDTVCIVGDELARELAAPPALVRDHTIIVRRRALKSLAWELFEEWCWRKPENAMASVVAHYDLQRDLPQALERITQAQQESLVLHERGELLADQLLGEAWTEMLSEISCRTTEIIARAARDHFADCTVLLPTLVHSRSWPQLHFFFANMTPMRKELFPALTVAYKQWLHDDDLEPLKSTIEQGRQHWTGFTRDILAQYQTVGTAVCADIKLMMDTRKL